MVLGCQHLRVRWGQGLLAQIQGFLVGVARFDPISHGLVQGGEVVQGGGGFRAGRAFFVQGHDFFIQWQGLVVLRQGMMNPGQIVVGRRQRGALGFVALANGQGLLV